MFVVCFHLTKKYIQDESIKSQKESPKQVLSYSHRNFQW